MKIQLKLLIDGEEKSEVSFDYNLANRKSIWEAAVNNMIEESKSFDKQQLNLRLLHELTT